jgi:hypothetical protein
MSINIAPRTLRVEYRRNLPRLFAPGGDPDDNGSPSDHSDFSASPGEELAFKVEIWDLRKLTVERVVAVTASRAIGYGAYYAAAREYPNRYITLRFKGSLVASWNPPGYP